MSFTEYGQKITMAKRFIVANLYCLYKAIHGKYIYAHLSIILFEYFFLPFCEAWRAEGHNWESKGDGAELWAPVWCCSCEHWPGQGLSGTFAPHQQTGHRASVGSIILAALRYLFHTKPNITMLCMGFVEIGGLCDWIIDYLLFRHSV